MAVRSGTANFLAKLSAIAGLALLSGSALAREGKVALTFDDLPALTILQDQAYVDYLNATILRGLKRHHFPAIGFVNAGKVDELQHDRQVRNLRQWLDAGMVLGNHTFSHESPNAVGAAAYIADISRGEPILRQLLGSQGMQLRWFRHPFLETGYPAPVKHEIDVWLDANLYRVAPVTIDADDWEFAEPYDDAIARHDRKLQRRIIQAYLVYTAKRIDWSKRSANALFGRSIAQVMLLHCTRLNADVLDKLAALLKRSKLRPISLEEAMHDPAYRLGDPVVSKDGLNWLERWATSLHKQLPDSGDEDPPRWIQLAYDKVDNDRR